MEGILSKTPTPLEIPIDLHTFSLNFYGLTEPPIPQEMPIPFVCVVWNVFWNCMAEYRVHVVELGSAKKQLQLASNHEKRL